MLSTKMSHMLQVAAFVNVDTLSYVYDINNNNYITCNCPIVQCSPLNIIVEIFNLVIIKFDAHHEILNLVIKFDTHLM